jgi:hypothetical protein
MGKETVMRKRYRYLLVLMLCLVVACVGIGAFLTSNKSQNSSQLGQNQTLLPGEKEFLEMLRLWAKENNGKFPDELSIASVQRFYTATGDEHRKTKDEYREINSELEPKIEERIAREGEIFARLDELDDKRKDVNEIRSMTREQWKEYSKELDVISAESKALWKEMDELDKLIAEDQAKIDAAFEKTILPPETGNFDLKIGLGMRFYLSLSPENDPHYLGTNVAYGDSQIPIFWYKPRTNEDRYRIVYGDLRIKGILKENLPKLRD